VTRHLRDVFETLSGGSVSVPQAIPLNIPPIKVGQNTILRARALLKEDIEQIVIHPVRSEAAKPFARAEIIASGKGLLGRVAFVVAGAGFEPATFGL